MTRTVLVGVAESTGAHRAIEWATRWALDHRASVELLAVVGMPAGVAGEDDIVADALGRTEILLDEHAARLRRRGIECRTRLLRGKPVQELIDASESAGLLVIGSDSRGAGSEGERGPHGMRIAAGARCPVVVVPDIDLAARANVVVGVDGSETSENALRFAIVEADRLGEPLVAISTWSPFAVPLSVRSYPQPYETNMRKLTEEMLAIALAGVRTDHPDLRVRRVVEAGYPEIVLNRWARGARLLVVGSHGRGAVGRFLLGSTSQAVLSRLGTVTAIVC